jgi:hypothetical protein
MDKPIAEGKYYDNYVRNLSEILWYDYLSK